jgi:hypothetical protein
MRIALGIMGVAIALLAPGCSGGGDSGGPSYTPPPNPLANPPDGIPAGNPDGHSVVPAAAWPVDTSTPDHVIGTGTPASCTPEAFIAAVALGGKIVFNGGSAPFTITLTQPSKVYNNANPDVVIDGGGLVTLSGGGATRILYMNTCDPALVWTTR